MRVYRQEKRDNRIPQQHKYTERHTQIKQRHTSTIAHNGLYVLLTNKRVNDARPSIDQSNTTRSRKLLASTPHLVDFNTPPQQDCG